jgi:hypothetical protein
MTTLATDRTTNNTATEHVDDHNTIHEAVNLLTNPGGVGRANLDDSARASLDKADSANQDPTTVTLTASGSVSYGNIVLVDTTLGAVTVTLPAPAANRRPIYIKKITADGNAVVMSTVTGVIEFSGSTRAFAGRGTAYTMSSNGTDWFVVESNASHMTRHSEYLMYSGGETVIPRLLTTRNDINIGSGSLKLMYMRAKRSEAITQLRMATGSTVGTSPTLFRMGVYEVDPATLAHTLIAASDSLTTGLTTTSTTLTRTLTTTWNKVEGKLYGLAFLALESGTLLWEGTQTAQTADTNVSGSAVSSSLAAQTDLPSTIADASLSKASINYVQLMALP